MRRIGGQNGVQRLRLAALRAPSAGGWSESHEPAFWNEIGFPSPPEPIRAAEQHAAFREILTTTGVDVIDLPADGRCGPDSVYACDAALPTDDGILVFTPGKPNRREEGVAMAEALAEHDVPVLGRVEGTAGAEGGDFLWLDPETLVMGRTFRTDALQEVREWLSPKGVDVFEVDMPYGDGPGCCLHLLSVISPLDQDLFVVHRPLLPTALFQFLTDRGATLVDVSTEEYATLGCNVLALSPRNVVAVDGNPETRRRMEDAGCRVTVFEGDEICLKGSGGPTCLVQPLLRD